MPMEHQFINSGESAFLKGRTGVIYEERDGQQRQYRWRQGEMQLLGDMGVASILVAWRAQPKLYKLAAIPAITHYVNVNTGNDSTGDGSKANPYKTLDKIKTLVLPAGSCIGLSNDSTFDLTNAVSFATASGTGVNGSSDSTRWTLTNYDPGGYPNRRPRIRFRYVPLAGPSGTVGGWTWDAANSAWYFTNPNARNFSWEALCRFPLRSPEGVWGENRAIHGGTPGGVGTISQHVVADYDFWAAADVNPTRIYVYAPAGIDPTTYYGGAGSVVLGEGQSAALQFSRCGKFATVDGIVFEDCGVGLAYGNWSGTESLAGLKVQRCTFINCGVGQLANQDLNSAYTMQWDVLQNVYVGMGVAAIKTQCKARDQMIAGNYIRSVAHSTSFAGGIYVQESKSGSAVPANNVIAQNYIEDVKFNRGRSPYDGACIYPENGSTGWAIFGNFMTKSHIGIHDNSGGVHSYTHNVFDDVDIPLGVSDDGAHNGTNSTAAFNTAINIGIDRYRAVNSAGWLPLDLGGASRVPMIVWESNIGAAAVVKWNNNLLHFAPSAAPRAAISVKRTIASYDLASNQVGAGAFSVAPIITTLQTTADQAVTPTGLSRAAFALDANYQPLSGVALAFPLAAHPNPMDAYGVISVTPPVGASAGGFGPGA